ncbi:hypothetical protein GLOTRDRAFT_100747, partial [Gloeophyllum trabeum ATCC 11539]
MSATRRRTSGSRRRARGLRRGACCSPRWQLRLSAALPLSITVNHSPIKIDVVHGHQCIPTGDLDSLGATARQMDVESIFQAVEYDNHFFVNPGSATGAWTGACPVVVTYVYQLIDGEVRVETFKEAPRST